MSDVPEMVLKVAKAIDDEYIRWMDEGAANLSDPAMVPRERLARAAIAAMREPTRQMLADGATAIDEATKKTRDEHEEWIVTDAWDYALPGWQAMIDTALTAPASASERRS